MPNYISKINLPDGSPFELKMPHALTINNRIYDGTKAFSVGSAIHYADGTGTDAKTTSPYNYTKWQADISSVTGYYNGLTIAYKIPVSGHDVYGTCLQINNLGYHPVVRMANSAINTRYGVNSTILLIYQSSVTGTIYNNSANSSTIKGCWVVVNDADINMTYSAGAGIALSGTTFSNSGVRSVSTGTTNGTIAVNTNGTVTQVQVKGLGSAAYTNSANYATSSQGAKADAAMPATGGTFSGTVTLAQDPSSDLQAATKKYVDNNVKIISNVSSGTEIATITINGKNTKLYSPGTPSTISVTQSANTPTLEFIGSTNTEASGALTGVTSATSLTNGKIIIYRIGYTLPGTVLTLTLSMTNGASLGTFPINIDGNTQCKNAYSTGTMLMLVFYQNKFYIVNPFGGIIA